MEDTYMLYILGLIFMMGGAYVLSDNLKKIKHWKRIDAVVERHIWEYKRDSDGNGRTAKEVFLFMVGDEEIRAESKFSSSHPLKINEIVEIVYNPQNPSDILVVTNFRIYIFPLIFILIGIFIISFPEFVYERFD